MIEPFTLEVHQSKFEIDRAIDAYIPLLEACYALAKDQPFALPKGYTELSRVEASPAEFAAMAATPTPEVMAFSQATRPELFGFVVREDTSGQIIVSIRGTLVLLEWLKSFTAVPVPYSFISDFGLVHLGFELVYKSIRASIRQALGPVPPDVRVTVLGHSLGGAVATVAAPDIAKSLGRSNVDVCTFGGPRCGKPDFRSNFNKLVPVCVRVTNPLDIVTHVPSIATLWLHTGENVSVPPDFDQPHSLDSYLAGLRKMQQPGVFGEIAAAAGLQSLASAVVP